MPLTEKLAKARFAFMDDIVRVCRSHDVGVHTDDLEEPYFFWHQREETGYGWTADLEAISQRFDTTPEVSDE